MISAPFSRLRAAAALLLLAVALAGCDDTIHGMGRDMEDAGQAIQNAVQ